MKPEEILSLRQILEPVLRERMKEMSSPHVNYIDPYADFTAYLEYVNPEFIKAIEKMQGAKVWHIFALLYVECEWQGISDMEDCLSAAFSFFEDTFVSTHYKYPNREESNNEKNNENCRDYKL